MKGNRPHKSAGYEKPIKINNDKDTNKSKQLAYAYRWALPIVVMKSQVV